MEADRPQACASALLRVTLAQSLTLSLARRSSPCCCAGADLYAKSFARLPHLKTLNLSRNKLASIARVVLNTPGLVRLNLSQNRLDPAALVAHLGELTQLIDVTLSGNRISRSVIDDLRGLLSSNCLITAQ